MTSRAPEISAETVAEFAEVAERFCSVIDKMEELSEIDFLRQIDILVPLAYAKALELPNLGFEDERQKSWHAKIDARDTGHHERWDEVHRRIRGKLGDHNWFRHAHDPFGPEDQEIHGVDLADELAEVYVGLENGLHLHRQDPHELITAVRAWKDGVETFWGDNAMDAIPAVSRLVHQHY